MPTVHAQQLDIQEAEDLSEVFDHQNWYTLEMVIFSRPLEDASVLMNNDPNLEQLRLRKQINLPALIKTLLPAPIQVDRPQNIGLLNALLNSYQYRTTAKSTQPDATPELDDLLLWINEIKGVGEVSLEVLTKLETAGQYWPYIEPLFAKLPKRLAPTVSSLKPTLPERPQNDDAMLIEIPSDLAFRTSTDLRLLKEANRLSADARYQILWHQAWHQPLSPRGEGIPLLIQGQHSAIAGTDLPFTSLDGLATVELGRFLHVRLQLWTKPPESPVVKNKPTGFIEFSVRARLRSNEYHYLDHPYLGVIMLIVPLEPKHDRLSPQRYSF